MSRPRILVSRGESVVGERWEDYGDRVAEAGGEPVEAAMDAAHPGDFDGLMLTAGVDVDPARYGEAQSERVQDVLPERDEFEAALIQEAIARSAPVLAICRGSQILNVAHGGRLIQHLAEREPHRARRAADGVGIDSGWHDVVVRDDSLLAALSESDVLHVNSRHHQAIPADGVAPGFIASATAPDGVVEAIERADGAWVLGIQWHPELTEMWDRPECYAGARLLIERFVAACEDDR